MKAKLVQIGNSRGIRLPKPMIEEARLRDDVDIHVVEGSIVITSNLIPRSNWGVRRSDSVIEMGTCYWISPFQLHSMRSNGNGRVYRNQTWGYCPCHFGSYSGTRDPKDKAVCRCLSGRTEPAFANIHRRAHDNW